MAIVRRADIHSTAIAQLVNAYPTIVRVCAGQRATLYGEHQQHTQYRTDGAAKTNITRLYGHSTERIRDGKRSLDRLANHVDSFPWDGRAVSARTVQFR